jgi:hypothetical protein
MSMKFPWIQANGEILNAFFGAVKDLYSSPDSSFPRICPNCCQKTLHIYLATYPFSKNRASVFIWCGNCKCANISTGLIISWWEDLFDFWNNAVDDKELSLDFFDEKSDLIDAHINKLLSTRKVEE